MLRSSNRLFSITLITLAGIFVSYFVLPNSSYSLSLENPTIITYFTSHYTHLNLNHLIGNAFGFTVIATSNTFIAKKIGRESEYLTIFLFTLLLLPYIISEVTVLIGAVDYSNVSGFSAIVSAHSGIFVVLLTYYLSKGDMKTFHFVLFTLFVCVFGIGYNIRIYQSKYVTILFILSLFINFVLMFNTVISPSYKKQLRLFYFFCLIISLPIMYPMVYSEPGVFELAHLSGFLSGSIVFYVTLLLPNSLIYQQTIPNLESLS